MNLLLDTCTFLWLNLDVSQVSPAARELCADSANQLFFSAVSAWEISAKYYTGRLALPEAPGLYIPKCRAANGLLRLNLHEEAAFQVSKLPPIHKDPFDRILICQALTHGLAILTPDPHIARYPVRILW